MGIHRLAGQPAWSLSSLAPADTHLEKGVPFWPATRFLLSSLHAVRGLFVVPLASFAIAVTHLENGVPFCPSTCFLLWSWQYLPYALAFAGRLAVGPGVAGLFAVPWLPGSAGLLAVPCAPGSDRRAKVGRN